MRKFLAIALLLVVCSAYAEIASIDTSADGEYEYASAWKCNTEEEASSLLAGFDVKSYAPHQSDEMLPGYYVFFLKQPVFDISYGACYGMILEKKEGSPVVWTYVITR